MYLIHNINSQINFKEPKQKNIAIYYQKNKTYFKCFAYVCSNLFHKEDVKKSHLMLRVFLLFKLFV